MAPTISHYRPTSPVSRGQSGGGEKSTNGLRRCSSSFRSNDGLSVIAAERRERRRGLISRIYHRIVHSHHHDKPSSSATHLSQAPEQNHG
jgi:hypothetical protein